MGKLTWGLVCIGSTLLVLSCTHRNVDERKGPPQRDIAGGALGGQVQDGAIDKYVQKCEEMGGVANYYTSQEKVTGLDSEDAFPVSLPANWVGQIGFSSFAYFKDRKTQEVITSTENMTLVIAEKLKMPPEQVNLHSADIKKWVTARYDVFIFDPKSNMFQSIGYIDHPEYGSITGLKINGKESCSLLREKLIAYPQFVTYHGQFELTKFNISDAGLEYVTHKFCENSNDPSIPASIVGAFKELKTRDHEKNLLNCVSMYHMYMSHRKLAIWFHMPVNPSAGELLQDYKKFVDKNSYKKGLEILKAIRGDASSKNVYALNSEMSIGVTNAYWGSLNISDNRPWKKHNVKFFTHPREMFYDLYTRYAARKQESSSASQIYVQINLAENQSYTGHYGWNGVITMYGDSSFGAPFAVGGQVRYDLWKEDVKNGKTVRTKEDENRYAIFRPEYIQGISSEKNKYWGRFVMQDTSPPLSVLDGDQHRSLDQFISELQEGAAHPTIGYFTLTKPNKKVLGELNGAICKTILENSRELRFSCPANLK